MWVAPSHTRALPSDRLLAAAQSLGRAIVRLWRGTERGLAGSALLLLVVLPVAELLLRALLATGLKGTTDLVQHLTLWVAFLGAMLAARTGGHLSLAAGRGRDAPDRSGVIQEVVDLVTIAVTLFLAVASMSFVRAEMDSAALVGGWFSVWVAELVLPLGWATIAAYYLVGLRRSLRTVALGLGAVAAVAAIWWFAPVSAAWQWGTILVLLAGAAIGLPIYVVLGGCAMVLLYCDGVPIAAVPVETYRLVVSPTIPAIPLFTLAGFLLAAGNASDRLVRLFQALFGWLPGGTLITTVLVCALFSTFTGASGVTILALGGLLLPVLIEYGYRRPFSVGLLTATGSIGLLFPPSLAVIMYGVVARVPINELFRAGILPGLLLVSAVCAYAVARGAGEGVARAKFDCREALAATMAAKWEMLLPLIVLGALFGGLATLIEAAAITAFYVLVCETLIHRDVRIGRDLPEVLVRCAAMLGGVFAILAVAMGLTNYLVDAMVPIEAASWVATHVDSRPLFLLSLNAMLLIAGCLMDIYSAIFVVVPLILPMGELFGVDPLHLAMIFLVNLELGYLTPPVGMNLFLASYRLGVPLITVYRSVLPFFFVLLAVVLLITYVPALTIGAY